MTPEAERETLRQMIIGSLALELPPEAFEVLKDIWDNGQMSKRKYPTGDQRGESV